MIVTRTHFLATCIAYLATIAREFTTRPLIGLSVLVAFGLWVWIVGMPWRRTRRWPFGRVTKAEQGGAR